MHTPVGILRTLLLLCAFYSPQAYPLWQVADLGGSLITERFQIYRADKDALTHEDAWQSQGAFEPLGAVRNVSAPGKEAWLRASIRPEEGDILEIPGQIFNYVDVWFRTTDGQVIHDYSGVRYPYIERSIKHTNVAFPIPTSAGEIDVLLRMRNDTSHPMHFAAIVWPQENWEDRLLNLRLWYGFYFGAIIILLVYNGFLALALRDVSYLFYGGYVSSLAFGVVLCSGLGEEFLWPEGKPAPMILAACGVGALFVVAFGNTFLRVRERYPRLERVTLLLGMAAALLGIGSIYDFAVPGIPRAVTATFFHLLVIAAAFYFIAISIHSYLKGMQQARFLILSMLVLFGSMITYWSYTYGYTHYNLYVGHFMEIGGLAEGVLLSLALSDRINILAAERREAQQEFIEYQRLFSRGLINAREKEKKALSEQMHDSVGHAMLVLINNLRGIADKLGDTSPENRARVEEQIEYGSALMDEIRGISHDLHPHMLTRLGLAAALESTVERAAQSKGLTVDMDIGELAEDLPEEVEIALYRIVQECLNNVLKYADARTIRFRLEQHGAILSAILEDDGRGFDPTVVEDSGGLGFAEIAGHAKLLGGSFDVDSQPGQGAKVSVRLPVAGV